MRHPKLRVNLIHAGLPFLEGTLAIMRRYPQVYADLSKISDVNAYPREQFHDYLRSLVHANLADDETSEAHAAVMQDVRRLQHVVALRKRRRTARGRRLRAFRARVPDHPLCLCGQSTEEISDALG